MCARLLKPGDDLKRGWFYRTGEHFLRVCFSRMSRSLSWALRHGLLWMLLLLATVCLNVYLVCGDPEGVFSAAGYGAIDGSIQADQNISFQAMQKKLVNIMDVVRQDPAVEVSRLHGRRQINSGFMFVS